jgi:uncharacterized protein (TIGR03643 family)
MARYEHLKKLQPAVVNTIIKLAWDDRTSFDYIKKNYSLTEDDVINLMRRELKPGSWRRWRSRVRARVTKHEKIRKDRYDL